VNPVNALNPLTLNIAVLGVLICGTLLARAQPATPGPRIGHSLVYHEQERRIMLLDGYSWIRAVSSSDPPDLTELWSWNGERWVRLPGSGPAARTMARAVYDVARGMIVSYGGRVGRAEAASSETWERDAAGWQRKSEAAAGPNVHVEMAYDGARRSTVRFGGALPDDVRRFKWPADTWEWKGLSWTRVATEGPAGRAASAMVYDSTRGEIVLFGGQGSAPAAGQPQPVFGDTWIWNGKSWRLASQDGPRARSYHAMSFDRRAGVVLLHGGNHRDEVFEDLWAWNGLRWAEVRQASPRPGKRRLHALAYDAARNRTMLYGGAGPRPDGGTQVHDDTWEWDGAGWTRMQ
jgi:hypothetical protein